MNLGKGVKITRVMNAQAVGTSAVNGSTLDMAGFDGVMFIGQFGTITDGTTGLKAQDGAASDLSDSADLAGTSDTVAITDDNKCAVLEIYRPLKRYIRAVALRGGSTGAVIDSVIAIQYAANYQPTTQDATVAAYELWASPSDGTA